MTPSPRKKPSNSLHIREVLLHWEVVNPGSEERIEELLPLATDVEHQGVTEEEVLQSKARCHPTKIEEVPA